MDKNGKKVVGFDLDGVIAGQILDGVFINLRILKEHFLKRMGRQKDYFYPKSSVERRLWRFLNRRRTPNCAADLLRDIKKETGAELILITSRFKFLEPDTHLWLKQNNLENVFDRIIINNNDLNPLHFKTAVLNENSIDYYLDDDLEILEGLVNKVNAKIFWLNARPDPGKKIDNLKSVSEFINLIREKV